jgi:CubicO group peptidase (beta-lactamase class C family)
MNLLLFAAMCSPMALLLAATSPAHEAVSPDWDWKTASPESQGMNSARLEALWEDLRQRSTNALLVIRNDRIVFERYAPDYSRTRPHYTASLAKALVGGVSLMVAIQDRRIRPDDPAYKVVPQWANDPLKRRITIRHLATHTSGVEDAEADNLPHDQLTGWKGEFWKQSPHDPFTLARDDAPILEEPGTQERYSNPGMAMLSYCITASLRGAPQTDLRFLLKQRIMEPLGVPPAEWSVGYGKTFEVDGLPLVADWGGGAYSPNAAARVGRLMLRRGDWNGQRLIAPSVVKAATTWAGMPNGSGLGWWVNLANGARRWKAAPEDAFWGSGAGHQFLLVVPSLKLIVVRNGGVLDKTGDYNAGLENYIVNPLMQAFSDRQAAPYPPSPVIKEIRWKPVATIQRQAYDCDCWPLTWGDDDALYTAYGDGYGFEPKVPEKLSLGFARVTGSPPDFSGVNIRSSTGEAKGNGPHGKKASGILMVNGVLYLWARNAENAQLAWSADHGQTWTWSDWKFTTSFGCPTFLNFGKNYAGARDDYVYIYSPDSESAYVPADRMVLARVPKDQIRSRAAYAFFQRLDASGQPIWTGDFAQRGAVFTHTGCCLRSQITYDPAIKRYLWWQQIPKGSRQQADTRSQGGFGIYDAPEPWGPWTTAYFTEVWDVGPGETASFPTKWMSADGRKLTLVFSGDDYFAVRAATLTLTRAKK